MKKILITGSGSGIGRLSAIALSKRGHFVYATTHTLEQSIELNLIARKYNLPLISFKLDLLCEFDRSKVDKLSIDVLINNAALGDSGSASEIDIYRYRATFDTNVFYTLELTQRVLRNMIKKGSGRIIFISSLAGRISIPFLSPYTSTKFAIEAIASSLIKEMKELDSANIDVTIIEPGAYATDFNQKNVNKQFVLIKDSSYFKDKLHYLKQKQLRYFKLTESKNLNSIVETYIKAVEDDKVKIRYTQPNIQGAIIQLQRILGK